MGEKGKKKRTFYRRKGLYRLECMMISVLLAGSSSCSVFAEKAGLAELAGGQTQEQEVSSETEQEDVVPETPAQQSGGLGGLAGGSAGEGEESIQETGENNTPDIAVTPAEKKKQTLMIYMCGSNLESDGGAATADLTEILRSGYNTEEINVLAMVGGSTKWWGGFPASETGIYEISGTSPKKVYGNELLNMGDPETLTTLLEFCHENYPADQYALDLWDHGGGPMSGVCWDSLASNDNLSMAELQSALESSFCKEEPLEWVGFDACLMASVETAYLMSPYAKYMIASQETEPGCGWSYSFLKGMEEDANGGETGSRIVENYFAETPKSQAGQLTLSCMDLSRLPEVQEKMDEFFSELSVDLTEETFSALSNMRQGTRGFGRADDGSQDYDLVDLTDLTEHYAEQNPEGAGALLEALEQAVVKSNSTMDGSHGISVYHPYYNKSLYEKEWEQEYTSFLFSPGYTQYIQNFAALLMGEAMGDWSKMFLPEETNTGEEDSDTFVMQLTEAQQETYASAQMLVLESIEIGGDVNYCSIYVSDEVTMEEGVLSSQYAGKALYAVSPEGEPLTGTLEYTVVDGKIRISANYIKNGEDKRAYTYFLCEQKEGSDELEIIGQYLYDEVSEQYTNRLTLDPSEYDDIYFATDNRIPTYEGDQLKAFSEWERGDILSAEVLYDGTSMDFRFQFIEQQMTDSQKFVTFQITDTQANVHSSEMQKVNNPNLKEIEILPEETKTEDYEVHVNGTLNSSKKAPYFEVGMEFVNYFPEEYDFTITSMLLNGTQSKAQDYWMYASLETGEREKRYVKFDSETLMNLREIHSLDCVLEVRPSGDYTAEPEIIPLHYTLQVDVSQIAEQMEGSPIAETENDGMRCELYRLEEQENGDLYGVLHWINEGTAEKSMQGEMILNGCLLDSSAIGFDLPAGADVWEGVEIYNSKKSDFLYYQEKKDLLASWGVEQLEHLTVYNRATYSSYEHTEAERYELNLEEPIPYEGKTEETSSLMPLLDAGNLVINLEKVQIYDGKLLLLVEVTNTSERDINWKVSDDSVYFDEIKGKDPWYGWTIPAHTVTYEYVSFQGDDSDSEEEAESLNFRKVRFDLKPALRGGVDYLYQYTMDLGQDYSLQTETVQEIPLEQIGLTMIEPEVTEYEVTPDHAEVPGGTLQIQASQVHPTGEEPCLVIRLEIEGDGKEEYEIGQNHMVLNSEKEYPYRISLWKSGDQFYSGNIRLTKEDLGDLRSIESIDFLLDSAYNEGEVKGETQQTAVHVELHADVSAITGK